MSECTCKIVVAIPFLNRFFLFFFTFACCIKMCVGFTSGHDNWPNIFSVAATFYLLSRKLICHGGHFLSAFFYPSGRSVYPSGLRLWFINVCTPTDFTHRLYTQALHAQGFSFTSLCIRFPQVMPHAYTPTSERFRFKTLTHPHRLHTHKFYTQAWGISPTGFFYAGWFGDSGSGDSRDGPFRKL